MLVFNAVITIQQDNPNGSRLSTSIICTASSYNNILNSVVIKISETGNGNAKKITRTEVSTKIFLALGNNLEI
ncbi:hypothetical protein [Imperialibacter sp. 89]|uniref:hypothetical protein n=1 Tax=Imperialibacter sp. 89 TaxID=2768856 RepID=UPI001F337FC3|nr:hypothetical protein [Imperialibacter sp. 89]